MHETLSKQITITLHDDLYDQLFEYMKKSDTQSMNECVKNLISEALQKANTDSIIETTIFELKNLLNIA